MSTDILLSVKRLSTDLDRVCEMARESFHPDFDVQLHKIEQELESVRDAVRRQAREVSGLFLTMSDIRVKSDITSEFIAMAETELAQLNADLEEVSLELLTQNTDAERLDEECITLEGEVHDAMENLFEKEDEIKRCKECHMEVMAQFCDLRNNWEEVETRKSGLNRDIEHAVGNVKRLRVEESRLHAKVTSISDRWRALRTEEDVLNETMSQEMIEKHEIEQEIGVCKASLTAKMQESEGLVEDLRSIETRIAEMTELQDEIRLEIENFQSQKEAAEKEKLRFVQSNTELEEVTLKLNQETNELDEINNRLKGTLVEVNTELRDIETEASRISKQAHEEHIIALQLAEMRCIRAKMWRCKINDLCRVASKCEAAKNVLAHKKACSSLLSPDAATLPDFMTPKISKRNERISPTHSGAVNSKLFPSYAISRTNPDAQPST